MEQIIIVLEFNSTSDFANGVSVTKIGGMSVTSYSSHQIMVKAAHDRLYAPGTLNFIPVSDIQLTVIPPVDQVGVAGYSVHLSSNPQVIVTNPMSDYKDQILSYTLTYFIAGNNPDIINADVGSYHTSVVFVIVPR